MGRMQCAEFDDELENLYREMGYSPGMFGGDYLTEEQMNGFIEKAKKKLPGDVSEMYQFGTLIDRAKENAPSHPKNIF